MKCTKDDEKWPIFVISLKDDISRRMEIKRQMDFYGLEFIFFDAVDGRDGLPENLIQLIDREGTVLRRGYPMKDAEYACALSHQMVYKKIIDLKLPGAIILEDDAILTDCFFDFYKKSLYKLDGVIQLYYFRATFWKFGKIQRDGIVFKKISENAYFTVGYSISRLAAEKIQKNSFPLRCPADWPCETFSIVNHYITEPRLILHPPEELIKSSIGDRAYLVPKNHEWGGVRIKGWRKFLSFKTYSRRVKRFFTTSVNIGFPATKNEWKHVSHLKP